MHVEVTFGYRFVSMKFNMLLMMLKLNMTVIIACRSHIWL